MSLLGVVEVPSLLLGLAVVLIAAIAAGRLSERLGQPAVVGEVVAGICLGPTVLGRTASGWLFPLEARPLLKILATLGLVVFMFILGMEMDLSALRGRGRRVAGGVIVGGTLVPFALGVALAFALYPSHDLVALPPFAVFIGAAMSVTAFPVLARILIARGIYTTPLGSIAMASAAGDDALTWIKVVIVVAIVTASGGWGVVALLGLLAAFAVGMIVIVKPLLARVRDRHADPVTVVGVVAGVLASSWATHTIGVHEIFGAFILGAVFPRGRLSEQLVARLSILTMLLLPMFFVTTGLSVDIGGIGSSGLWQLPLILVVACVGKLLGAAAGARSQGLALRESVALGVLMNTRGLTELVVLTIGLEAGVLDPTLFTMLVIMALVTTVATGPLLGLVRPDPWLGGAPDAPERNLRRVITLDEQPAADPQPAAETS